MPDPEYSLPLRRATPADVGAVRDLVRAAYARWVPVIGREPLPMTADYEVAVRDHEVWLLEDASGLLAVLELIPMPGHVLIENIAVRPGTQGAGLGGRLMAFSETQARALERYELRLYTNERMVSNQHWYQRLGFQETHREALPGSETMRVFMSKQLEM